jgi:hypothetical protein
LLLALDLPEDPIKTPLSVKVHPYELQPTELLDMGLAVRECLWVCQAYQERGRKAFEGPPPPPESPLGELDLRRLFANPPDNPHAEVAR